MSIHCVAAAAEPSIAEPCPSREAIIDAVYALLGRASIAPDELDTIAVADMGTAYEVTVKGRAREYSDVAHDCARRARTSAVFVALTLAPPDIAEPADPEPRVPPDVPEVKTPPATQDLAKPVAVSPPNLPAPPRVVPYRIFRLEVGAKAAVPADSGISKIDWGAQSRLVLGEARYAISLGFELSGFRSREYGAASVWQSRYTLDCTVWRNWMISDVRSSFGAGPLLTLTEFELLNSEHVSRWQPGMRLAWVVSLAGHFFSPFAGADVQVYPSRISVTMEPDGTVGHTSVVWVGATLGIVLGSY